MKKYLFSKNIIKEILGCGIISLSLLTYSVLGHAAGPYAYIGGYDYSPYGFIQVFDASTDEPVGERIDLKPTIRDVVVTPDGNKIYALIPAPRDSYVAVIDYSTQLVTKEIEIDPYPSQTNLIGSLAVSPEGDKVYVANAYGNHVTVIDAIKDEVINKIEVDFPRYSAVNPNSGRLYVTNRNGYISEIDPLTYEVTKFLVGGNQLDNIAIINDNLYVINKFTGEVVVVDAEIHDVLTKIYIGGNPSALVASPKDNRVYVSRTERGQHSAVLVVDARNNQIIEEIEIGGTPADIGVTPDGDKVYVKNLRQGEVNSSILVINTSNNETKEIELSTAYMTYMGGNFIGPEMGTEPTPTTPIPESTS